MRTPTQQSSFLTRRTFLEVAGAGTAAWLAAGRLSAADFKQVEKQLNVHTKVPLNAEPPLADLVESWLTPVESFYVRSYAPAPQIDLRQFRLLVEGLVETPLSLTFDELKNGFRRTSVVATLTCAGNRRSEFNTRPEHVDHPERTAPFPEIEGVQWEAGAIGNARWGGVRLSDLLRKAGVKEGARHVWFEGLDEIPENGGTIGFGGSVPIEKALGDTESAPGTLVAFEMNGEPLPPEHGFPVRTVVPGYIGARSVKWLGRIVVSDRPSDNHYVARAYKLVTQDDEAAWADAEPLYDFPLNSVICRPKPGAKVATGPVNVRGYALPPGIAGRTLARVEVSADGGKTWTRARFSSPAREYCWQLWEADLEIGRRSRNVMVRATDSAGNVQPQRAAWNLKGYLFNAWHEIPLQTG